MHIISLINLLVPYDGCQGVATVGLADQADGLPHADGLTLDVADDLWPLRGI